MSVSTDYGSKYWAITGEGDNLYLMADRLEVLPCGGLVAWGGFRNVGESPQDGGQIVFGLAAGQWHTFFAASMLDGRPVCADPEL